MRRRKCRRKCSAGMRVGSVAVNGVRENEEVAILEGGCGYNERLTTTLIAIRYLTCPMSVALSVKSVIVSRAYYLHRQADMYKDLQKSDDRYNKLPFCWLFAFTSSSTSLLRSIAELVALTQQLYDC